MALDKELLFGTFVLLLNLSSGLLLNNVDTGAEIHLEDQIKAMNRTIQSNKQLITSLTAKLKTMETSTPAVGFLAELSNTIDNPSKGSGIIFDLVHLNEGNAYDNVHGVFRAPIEGLYHFTLELSAHPNSGNHHLHIHMMKTTTQLGYIYLDDNNDRWLKRSTTATVHLMQNDDVWAKVTELTGPNTLNGGGFHSIFSGFLIKALP